MNDVQALRRSAPLITEVTPQIQVMPATLTHGGKTFRPFWTVGTWPAYNDIYQFEVEHGRMFNDIDDDEARNVCVIGTGVRDALFGAPAENDRLYRRLA